MKKLLALIGFLFFAALSQHADAAQINCRVYNALPTFAANTTPVIPCGTRGQLITTLTDTSGHTASVTAGGLVQVDGSGVTQPVSNAGTFAVQCTSGCSSTGGTSSNFGAAFPAAGTAGGFSDGTNMQAARVFDLDSGAGTQYGLGVDLRFIGNGGSVEAGTATAPLRVDPTGTTTQPVSGTVSITANSSVNVAQLAGTATDTNSGVKSAGTLRVVIATDQPQLTNKLLVTPDANSSVNVAQVGGSNVATAATGTQKVGIVGNAGGAVDAATGAAVPANALYIGANTGGNLVGSIKCQSSAIYDASTNGSTELVALTSNQTIYICGFHMLAGGTVTVKLIYGTGTACAVGTTSITPAYPFTAQAGLVDDPGIYQGLKTAVSNALCINTNAAVDAHAIVYYTKF